MENSRPVVSARCIQARLTVGLRSRVSDLAAFVTYCVYLDLGHGIGSRPGSQPVHGCLTLYTVVGSSPPRPRERCERSFSFCPVQGWSPWIRRWRSSQFLRGMHTSCWQLLSWP